MTRRITLFCLTLVLLTVPDPSWAQGARHDPFSARFQDDIVKVSPGDTFEFDVSFKVPKNHYLYDDKTSVFFKKTDGIILLKSSRPPAEVHFDPFLKKNVKVYFKNFSQKVIFKVPQNAGPGRRTLEAQLKYQGCSDDFCYRPTKKTIFLPVEILPTVALLKDAMAPQTPAKEPIQVVESEKVSFFEMLRENNPDKLLNQGKVYLLLLAFVGGILTSFTPCVLPIIPLTLAFIGVKHRRRGNLLRALMLVAGIVTMYALLGFLAATLGLQLGFLFQSRYFVLFTALFFFIFALGLFEIIPFQLPSKLHSKFAQMGGEGPVGTYLAGLTIGLIASPCVGPLIAPLLLIAARSQDRAYGFMLLLNYGMGMGLIFLVLASGFAELNNKLKAGKWTHTLKRVMAVLMLAPALYYGYAFAKPFLDFKKDALWVYDFDQGMTIAQTTEKPILLDFFADWCPPCVELDKRTFSRPNVREMAEKFVMLKIDCTLDDDNCQKATNQYEVVGWPTILFLRSNGQPIEDVQWMGGFANEDKMLELMNRALEKVQ